MKSFAGRRLTRETGSPRPSEPGVVACHVPLPAPFILFSSCLPACIQACTAAESAVTLPPPAIDVPASSAKGLQTAVFAGGCFWGVEAVFRHVKGVSSAVSGYAGGAAKTADYEMVSTGTTGHAESVKVIYDPTKVSYGQLLTVFFSVAHDPTQLNRQGPDHGTQYRSAIFTTSDEQKRAAKAYVGQLDRAKVFPQPIVTEIVALPAFYPAEDYHQNYLALHPTQPYIVYQRPAQAGQPEDAVPGPVLAENERDARVRLGSIPRRDVGLVRMRAMERNHLSEAGRPCRRCGCPRAHGEPMCGRCGTRSSPRIADDAPASIFLDTIHLPGVRRRKRSKPASGRHSPCCSAWRWVRQPTITRRASCGSNRLDAANQDGTGRRSCFPASGRSTASCGSRGSLFALLPLAGAFAFGVLAHVSTTHPCLGCSVRLAIWLLPGIIPALSANSLLYRRVRRTVAQRGGQHGQRVAGGEPACAPQADFASGGCLLGGGAIALAADIAAPSVRMAWFEHEVRMQVAAALASVRPLQQQIEDSWDRFRAVPRKLDVESLRVQAAAALLDEVSFRPANGRLRLGLGPSIPELFGRSILLAPAVDASQRIRWTCIPVDIPAQYLPKDCSSD